MSLQRYRHSSSFPSCFRPSSSATTTSDNKNHHTPPSPPPSQQTSGKTNLSTSLHHTNLGIFSLTWSRTAFLGHSLHLHLHPHLHFHLSFNSFSFWKKHGCKKLSSSTVPNVKLYWDLSLAKFGSGPEPESGFFIAVVVDSKMMLLVGDATKEAYARTKAQKPVKTRAQQGLVLRKEHVFGNKVYTTKARFGGKMREISIDCKVNEDAKLCFRVDNKRVLQIKRLKWKFRGNERIEVDGVFIQVSWDVYNWLFDKDLSNGHAVFVFKFENDHQVCEVLEEDEKNGDVLWQQSSCSSSSSNGIEWKKMRRNLLRTARSSSSSSISMSSASSVGNSSVMEWTSVEESELSAPIGFSLLVYAWRK